MASEVEKNILLDLTSLKRRVLNAGAWSLAGYCISQAIRLGSNLIMTRLLAPEMFGVMAIATMVLVGLALFSDLGIKQNIIQSKRGCDSDYLNTGWSIQILRGGMLSLAILLFAVLLLLANHAGLILVGSVYADPRLPYVIAGLSINAVISGGQSTKLYEANRSLSLGRLTKIAIASQIAGLVSMLGWALVDRSVWAMVVGAICSQLATTVLSHAWLPGVANRWHWDNSAVREIVHFGKWIFLSSILGFLVSNGDRVLLGGLLSPNMFGIYVIALLIVSSVEIVLTKIIGDILFPALSEMARERPADLKRSYYRLQVIIASFAYFCSGALMASGEPLISLFYDRRYEQAGWMVQILAAILITVPFRSVTEYFMALGRPHLLSHTIAVRLVAVIAGTLTGFHFFGIAGAVWGIAASHFMYLPLVIFYGVRDKILDIKKELCLLPIVLGGFAAGKLFVVAIGFWQ